MNGIFSKIGRRSFLHQLASCAGISFCRNAFAVGVWPQSPDLQKRFDDIRANLIQLVNEERAVEKLGLLQIDELATRVATAHAIDMATGAFASHWGRDGLKPYMRYSFAGGAHATQENVSAADNTWSMKASDLGQDTSYLHVRLYQEKPPDDGHRRAILAPQHTHVGFGVAVDQLRLRLVELFVAKYVEVTSAPRQLKPNERFNFAGRLFKADHLLHHIEVFYEPLPKAPDLSWLRESRSYSLPTDSVVLLPKLPPPLTYVDGTTGVIEVGLDGSFTVAVTLFRDQPGIYTIVCWVKRSQFEKAFPATELCLRAE